MSIYTHYTIEATTRLGEVYVWNPLISEYKYQNNQESSDISTEDEALDEFGYAVAAADNDEYMKVSLLRVTELSNGSSDVSVIKFKNF
nr:MAG TPA: hypothetical protein [Caudoviricetes sp.]